MLNPFVERVRSGEATVAVVGLGYVGLPLAVAFARAGVRVLGLDINPARVASLNDGVSVVEDVSSLAVAGAVESGLFEATLDAGRLSEADAVVICVPTPLRTTRDPDMTFVVHASERVAAALRPGQLVVLESTSYPGTTREILLPRLEAGGLRAGRDFYLAFSPERVDPGRTDWTTTNTPKVVGGLTPACLDAAMALYSAAVENLVPVSSLEVAEMSKVYENTFRAVNIGLANELLLMCDRLGIDAWEVIDAASTKPFGFMRFTPGPGLGGHCIPVDPGYLSWKLRGLDYVARFIELASEVNGQMPAYWVQRTQDALNERGRALSSSTVLVLGVAYKPDVADLRESPALDILLLLEEKGARVRYHDPHVPGFQHAGRERACVADLSSALAEADAVIVATDHREYRSLDLAALDAAVVNTRGPRAAAVPVPPESSAGRR